MTTTQIPPAIDVSMPTPVTPENFARTILQPMPIRGASWSTSAGAKKETTPRVSPLPSTITGAKVSAHPRPAALRSHSADSMGEPNPRRATSRLISARSIRQPKPTGYATAPSPAASHCSHETQRGVVGGTNVGDGHTRPEVQWKTAVSSASGEEVAA